jgi:hypothetical protein
MVRSLMGGVLKLTALMLVLIIVAGNIAVRRIPGIEPDGGVKGVLTAPIKVIEHRRENGGNVSIVPTWYPSKKSSKEDRPPYVGFDGETLWRDTHSPEVRAYVGEIINESIKRIHASGYKVTPRLVRGTAYVLLLKKVNYVFHISGTYLPSYTIEHGGVCRDWALVDYALILAINERFNITAEYFFVHSKPPCSVGHAFLAVHYPQTGSWELYDWFATPYLESPYESPKFKFMEVGNNEYVLGWFPVGVAIANEFSSLKEALSVYALNGGYLKQGSEVYLYQLPSFVKAREYSTEYFEIDENAAREKMKEIDARHLYDKNQYHLMFKSLGNGNAKLLDATVKDDFIQITIELVNIPSSMIELTASDRSWIILYDTGGATLAEWKRVTHIGKFPAYKYALLKGIPKKPTLLISLDEEYFDILPWKVTIKSYMGNNGVVILFYRG